MYEVIDSIHASFLEEACHSPLLLSDLSSMERYIAESYSGRSLIELLQNADDAGAQTFSVDILDDNRIVVSNDGRVFTEDDVLSLCRSGASTKKRKGDTIGYRGIGFKSVVNYANEVHLVSGDISLTFSRDLTAAELPTISNVPLIRVPHRMSGIEYMGMFNEKCSEGFNTVFVFSVLSDGLLNEVKQFDPSSLLFLRNINHVIFSGLFSAEFFTEKTKTESSNTCYTKINSQSKSQEWLVINDASNINAIAFLTENGVCIPAPSDEAVIHSFMPTQEKFIIPCKINGDFSTDPSRTRILLDEESRSTANKCAELMAHEIRNIMLSQSDNMGIAHIASLIFVDPLGKFKQNNINDYFMELLQGHMMAAFNQQSCAVQPEWLDSTSFLEIANDKYVFLITENSKESIPGLLKFCKSIGFKEYTLMEALKQMTESKLSEKTCAKVLAKSISSTRFSVSDDIKKAINDAWLIYGTEGLLRFGTITKTEQISEHFINLLLTQLADSNDLRWFFNKMNIVDNIPITSSTGAQIETDDKTSGTTDQIHTNYEKPTTRTFGSSYSASKWRSSEENVADFLKTFPDVVSVKDVSKMNIGYDIEVQYVSGNTRCFEVKSLNSLGDSFVMTNNEYSLATQNGSHYSLALCSHQQKGLTICIIDNPVNSLDLTRRVVRWEWVCNAYTGSCHEIPYGEGENGF